jgi:hypothetical protein
MVASRAARGTGSRSTRPESIAVIIGLVNWIAVASASGIAITPRKKQMVASPTAAPRPNCSHGRGITKPARPCTSATATPSPSAPNV